ncbi:MAG: hypothetical protein KC468_16915, partial [Myxococcales bacterium]|nr:hypothetical protein [Myxococcales bacterium]
MTKKSVLKKQAKRLLRRPKVDTLAAWLDANPRGVTVLEDAGALPRLLQRERVAADVIALLLERGVDASRGEDDYSEVPLAVLAQNCELDVDAKRPLIELLLARGASLETPSGHHGYTPLDWAARQGDAALVSELLGRGLSEQTRLHALNVAIEAVRGYRADARDKPEAIVEQLLARVESLDAHDRRGFAPVHAAALHGDARMLERLLARGIDVNLPLAADAHQNLDEGSPPGGGVIPRLRLRAGLTALDVVECYRASLVAKQGEYEGESQQFDLDRRSKRLAQLDLALARLREVDGVRRAPPPDASGDAPVFKREIDACLERLVARAGGDLANFRRAAELVDLRGCGPWGYLSALLSRARAELLAGPVAAVAEEQWLGRLLTGSAQRWLRATRKARNESAGYSAKLLEACEYPEEAAAAIGQDLFVGGRERAALGLWKRSPKVARVVEVSPEGFEVLGEDPVDFAKRQVARLLGEQPPAPTVYMEEPDEDAPMIRVMNADYTRKPGPTDINRVGGLPIGVDARSWPTRRGKKMHHVLTVSLDHPMFRDDVKAVALFLSSPMSHEAYRPRSPEARVLVLRDRDLEKGEPASWPEDIPEDDRLEAGVITFESGDTLGERELFQRSFIGGEPIWLQGDDTESMYDEDEYGDDYGDDEDYEDEDYEDEDCEDE